MNLQETFNCFADLVEERLKPGIFSTEDSIRYTFFLALIQSGYCHHIEVELEKSHPTIKGAEIDLLVRKNIDRPSFACEFKYDRINPSLQISARTQSAGALFKDMFRLAHIPKEIADSLYVIYLTDIEMARYYRNPKNRMANLLDLSEEDNYYLDSTFVDNKAKTFRTAVQNLIFPCNLHQVFRKDYPGSYYLRIYQVIR